MEQKKNKGGRPTKLTKKLIDTLERVVDEYIYCTDEEILFMLNEELEEKERITDRVFQAYKAGDYQTNNPLLQEFSRVIKKALLKEKMNLLNDLRKGEKDWTAKAWILERKFSEWNIRHKIENIGAKELNITVESEKLKKMIDEIE